MKSFWSFAKDTTGLLALGEFRRVAFGRKRDENRQYHLIRLLDQLLRIALGEMGDADHFWEDLPIWGIAITSYDLILGHTMGCLWPTNAEVERGGGM